MSLEMHLGLWLYISIIPLVALSSRERGASDGVSYLLGITWPIAYLLGIIWMGVRDAWHFCKR